MRKTFMVLLLNLLFLISWGYNVQGQTDSQSQPSAIQRDIKQERAVEKLHSKIKTWLKDSDMRKLIIASRALLKGITKSPETNDPYKMALAEVNKQFVGLTAEQSEILSFYILADIAQLGSKLVEGKKVSVGDDGLSAMESLRLQKAMDKRSRLFDTLGKIMERYDQSAKSVIQSMRG